MQDLPSYVLIRYSRIIKGALAASIEATVLGVSATVVFNASGLSKNVSVTYLKV